MALTVLHQKAAWILAGAALLLTATSCSAWKSGAVSQDPFRLYLNMETANYRPNEPLVLDVCLANRSEDPRPAALLNYGSLRFWLDGTSLMSPVLLEPVRAETEPPVEMSELPPDILWQRRFLFTQATPTTGTFQFIAVYSSHPPGIKGPGSNHTTSSRPLQYQVAGAPSYQRDLYGILERADALRIARERAGGQPPVREEIRLVRNEAGTLDWFVRLAFEPPRPPEAYLINPYLARVRRSADPAQFPKAKEEVLPTFMKQAPEVKP